MRTPASIAGHPIHAMLIVFPVGLLVFSLVCDLISLGSSHPDTWALVALYTMGGGVISALIVAVPGLIDLLSLRNPATKRIAVIHMSINLTVVALFVINWWMRSNGSGNTGTPLILSIIAIALLAISGWLGGQMVHVHGVGVEGAGTTPQ